MTIRPRLHVLLAGAIALAACRDASHPTTPATRTTPRASEHDAVSTTYDLATIQQWFPAASAAVLALPTAAYADINVVANLLEFGVVDDATRQEAIVRLGALGIPSDAYVIDIVGPIVEDQGGQSLRDKIRPTVGGVQIQYTNAANGTSTCTLGFNIQQAGKRYFVTASHCTQVRGGVEQTPFFQSLRVGQPGSSIGVEERDPQHAGGGAGCPANRVCRASDAALVHYNAATPSTLARIARPDAVNNGSLTIDNTTPLFSIAAVAAVTQFAIGAIGNKVGRTTGWTQGPVTRTCANVNVANTNVTLLCQTQVRFNQQGGDSGAPVFEISQDGTVVLWGIVTLSESVNGVTHGWFSPFPSVASELGFTTLLQ